MKTVQFKLIEEFSTSGLDENGDLFHDTEHVEVELERHIPENAFERQLFSQTITYAVWLSTKHNGIGSVPINSIKHLIEGYAADLDLNAVHWDEMGRLHGIVRIVWSVLPRESTYFETFDFPIYYSLVSSLESTSDCVVRILYEFAPTPFSKMAQWGMAGSLSGYSRLLPILDVPRGHPLYQEEPAPSDDDNEFEDVDLDDSWEDGRGDSTESWLAGMSADERAATMNNLDWND